VAYFQRLKERVSPKTSISFLSFVIFLPWIRHFSRVDVERYQFELVELEKDRVPSDNEGGTRDVLQSQHICQHLTKPSLSGHMGRHNDPELEQGHRSKVRKDYVFRPAN